MESSHLEFKPKSSYPIPARSQNTNGQMSGKRSANFETPSSKKSRTDLEDTPPRLVKIVPGLPKVLDGGVRAADVVMEYEKMNDYMTTMKDLKAENEVLAEWVAMAFAWGRKTKNLRESCPWWDATKQERREALSTRFG